MSLAIRIWAAALLLTLLLVGLVVRETQARAAGREVRLAMQTVDPRDLLTGHYVELQLTEALPPGQACPPGLADAPNRPGWLALTPGPQFTRVSGFAATRAEAARLGPVVMRGKAYCYAAPERNDTAGSVTLDIGVRRFHADQAQAESLAKGLAERRRGDATAFAVVSVGEDGKARLKGVIVGGRRADLPPW
jgi:hypothetical protein